LSKRMEARRGRTRAWSERTEARLIEGRPGEREWRPGLRERLLELEKGVRERENARLSERTEARLREGRPGERERRIE